MDRSRGKPSVPVGTRGNPSGTRVEPRPTVRSARVFVLAGCPAIVDAREEREILTHANLTQWDPGKISSPEFFWGEPEFRIRISAFSAATWGSVETRGDARLTVPSGVEGSFDFVGAIGELRNLTQT